MNDLTMLMVFLTKTSTEYSTFSRAEYMSDEAISLDAVLCISVRDLVNFYFNKRGRLVGNSTDARQSFKKADNK